MRTFRLAPTVAKVARSVNQDEITPDDEELSRADFEMFVNEFGSVERLMVIDF